MSIDVPKPPPRVRRTAEAARANILAAAEAILLASGPQALKLTEVAAGAGVVHATVLHHFGSIDGVQTALMEKMVRQLVDTVLAITTDERDPEEMASLGIGAMFDAFQARGVARLAAWLELTGESRRLTSVRAAVREVIEARTGQFSDAPDEAIDDFFMVCITLALGAGLFGTTLETLLGRPEGRARKLALNLLLAQIGDPAR